MEVTTGGAGSAFLARIRRVMIALGGVSLMVSLAASLLGAQSKLTVAAAANLGPALQILAADFEKRSGTQVALVFGSSGNLATQIEQGAPYDVFLSADTGYPRRLEQEGVGVRGSVRAYAVGKLVLWARKDSGVNVEGTPEQMLVHPHVRKIAIANPEHAPYGVAAEAYLKNTKMLERVKDKLVMGEDVAQAAEFVITGNAQAGILPLSLALAPTMSRIGKYHLLGREAPPVEQAAVMINRSANKQAAAAFLDFLKSPDAVAVLRKNGYDLPETAP